MENHDREHIVALAAQISPLRLSVSAGEIDQVGVVTGEDNFTMKSMKITKKKSFFSYILPKSGSP